ncbi:MAG: LysR family transcriptional regulator [Ruminococcaceae bacterium]|nr:LysR family transcriptional regulator [Oscillospiraceae bacterium]
MNTTHLKYIIEVEKTGSISKAAENLYMSQPQLSKAIRELEESVGISIFKRSSKGVVPTTKGVEFIMDAKGIIAQLQRLETTYNPKKSEMLTLDAVVARCEYISEAFSKFLSHISNDKKEKIIFRETNTTRSIKNVATGENNIGIIKYNVAYEQYFFQMLDERELKHEILWEYDEVIAVSKNSPLAKLSVVTEADLQDMTEILFGDNIIHYGRSARSMKDARENDNMHHILVYERAGMCSALIGDENSYSRITPSPEGYYDENKIRIIPMKSQDSKYRDVLFYRKDYKLTDTDKLFVEILKEVISEL